MADELRDLAKDAADHMNNGEPKAKRTKLKSYDQMPAQVLNANGESGISKTTLLKLAMAMKTGNKAAAWFNELCDPTPKRKGIAISRLSEIWLLNGAKLQDAEYKAHIKKELYNTAMKEFEQLEPCFKVLMGKGLSMEDDETTETVGRIAYGASSNADFKNPDAVNAAAVQVYEWLQRPQSKFRALTSLLSGGGLFYVASVHEKCHRAYIKHGYTIDDKPTLVTEEMYADWARGRCCSDHPVATNSDLAGL